MKDNFVEIAYLVKKLKAHDETVFPRLYELTYQRIYFLCFSILKNEEDAKDAVQDTYIKILANISSLQNDKLFVAWANKIAYSICIRMLSKNKPDLVEAAFLNSFADESQNSNLYETVEKSEKIKALSSFIDKLDPFLRSTLILKYFDNLKIKQIAEIMDCPEGTVKSRLNTAKKILKTAIQKERRGDILLSTFAYFPLRQALMYLASHASMSSEAADAAFKNIVAKSGLSSDYSFTPQPYANPMPFSQLGTFTIAGAGVVGTSAAALSTIIALTPPAIHNVEVEQPQTAYTRSEVSITASIDAPLKSISEVYLLSDTGKRTDGHLTSNNDVRFTVANNGLYTIHAVSSNNLEATAQIEVTAIDNEAPSVTSFSYTENGLVLKVDDMYSGIDFSAIIGETESGEQIHPVSFDENSQTVTFAFSEENFVLHLIDFAGNISYYNVEWVIE